MTMDASHRIVFELVGPANEADFLERLPNRPDWQQYQRFVRAVLDDELFAANARAEAAEAECGRLREELVELAQELNELREKTSDW